jgi:hypothetical protein
MAVLHHWSARHALVRAFALCRLLVHGLLCVFARVSHKALACLSRSEGGFFNGTLTCKCVVARDLLADAVITRNVQFRRIILRVRQL